MKFKRGINPSKSLNVGENRIIYNPQWEDVKDFRGIYAIERKNIKYAHRFLIIKIDSDEILIANKWTRTYDIMTENILNAHSRYGWISLWQRLNTISNIATIRSINEKGLIC